MKINWKLRASNPIFWAHIAVAIVTPIFTYFRINWLQMTSWPVFFGLLWEAMQNPVVFVAVLLSAWNCIIDPTTKGLSDSSEVLATPKCGCVVVNKEPTEGEALS